MFGSKFRGEVRDFMAVVRAGNTVIVQQNEIIDDLRKQNKELMNRFMASDFKELQTYTIPEETDLGREIGAMIDFTDDELAGEVIDVEGKTDE